MRAPLWAGGRQARPTILRLVAKDTEKLIRQLSLISFLMAQGRPVSALEIKREVEGYSDMNDDAFARRFYADRAELESLGIQLGVEKPGEGFFEAELYSLPPENFYLDAIEFSDDELAALSTALSLLTDGGFAYAEPLRLALQQVAWGHPNPLSEGERAPVEMAMTASAGGRDLSQRLSKIETAISRRKTIEFTYYTMERDETEKRKVDPYHLVFRGGQFYLIGHAHERDAVRVFRLSRIQGKVGYASKAEHDFSPPEDFDRRDYGQRADWQLGEIQGHGEDLRPRPHRLADRARLRRLRRAAPGEEVRRRAGQGLDLRDRLRLAARADRLGAALAPERQRAGARRAARGGRERGSPCSTTATTTASSRPRSSSGRCARRRAAPAPTAAARRRSGPSASPAWSPSPAC